MTAVGFAVFLLFGVCLVLLGANQQALAADLGLDLASFGLLGSALALGIGVGVAGAGPLVDRAPRRPLFVGSGLLAAGALLGMEPGIGYPRALAHMIAIGLAVGVQETLVNACVSQRHGARAARPLLVAHSGATLGAMLAPLAIAALGADLPWTASFRATGVAQLALAALCLPLRFPAPPGAALRRAAGPLPLTALLPFLLVGFAYVGVETSLTLFAVPYASETLGLPEARGVRAISVFWAGLLAGRLALLAVRRRIDARFLAAAGLAGAAVLAAGIGARLAAVELVYGAAGVAMGFVFPVLIALSSERAPEARGTATGLAAGAGAAGGLAIPPLHGGLGDRFGTGPALLALVAWCGVILLAAWAASRRARA